MTAAQRARDREARRRRRESRYTDTHEFGAMLTRMLAAYGKRVGQADMEDLREMVAMRDLLEQITAEAIHTLRTTTAYSWADIGEAMGTTRQAAQQRWGHPRTSRKSASKSARVAGAR